MDTSGSGLDFKVCSGPCGQRKVLTEFYSKGERGSDSCCKSCQLAKKQAGYKSKRSDRDFTRVKKVMSEIFEHRMERLRDFHEQLRNLLVKVEKRMDGNGAKK